MENPRIELAFDRTCGDNIHVSRKFFVRDSKQNPAPRDAHFLCGNLRLTHGDAGLHIRESQSCHQTRPKPLIRVAQASRNKEGKTTARRRVRSRSSLNGRSRSFVTPSVPEQSSSPHIGNIRFSDRVTPRLAAGDCKAGQFPTVRVESI